MVLLQCDGYLVWFLLKGGWLTRVVIDGNGNEMKRLLEGLLQSSGNRIRIKHEGLFSVAYCRHMWDIYGNSRPVQKVQGKGRENARGFCDNPKPEGQFPRTTFQGGSITGPNTGTVHAVYRSQKHLV
jgi:hypothetical protein